MNLERPQGRVRANRRVARRHRPVPLRLTLDVARLLLVLRLLLVRRRRLQALRLRALNPAAPPVQAVPPVRRWIHVARA